MTMMQKVQAKKSKKGFTLVELVIVIAILAILAAIAIPVITTTINSSKMSVMESDCATMNMLIKEAINNRLANVSTTTYNNVKATDDALTVADVCAENNLSSAESFFVRDIGAKDYVMFAVSADASGKGNGLTISVGPKSDTTYKYIVSNTTIVELSKAASLEA